MRINKVTHKKLKKMARQHGGFHPRKIKLVACDDKLTAAAGLGAIIEAFDESPLAAEFAKCLPERKSNRSGGSYRLGLIQLASFIYGHENIEDHEEFRSEPLLEAALKGQSAAPRTISDYLYDFEQSHIDALNLYLSKMSRAIRKQLIEILPEEFKPKENLDLSIDSTPHEQHGEVMEGLETNYKGLWCLDSQESYDELGFCHGFQLRPGATKSGVNADQLIHQGFDRLPHGEKKYLHGDSAYCNQDCIKTSLLKGVTFTFTAHGATTQWRSHLSEITQWEPWVYSKEEIEKAKKKNQALPKIELGRFYWKPSWAENLMFPIIVKRTWKQNWQPELVKVEQESLFKEVDEAGEYTDHDRHNPYKDYAVVTNYSLYSHSMQQVIEHHNTRGNAENFIKDDKYGLDLKHFPCKKLMANHAFGMLAMVAHNVLRWMALVYNPDKPHYSKKLRRRFIYIPGKIVSHARQIVLKIPTHFHKEVNQLIQALRSKPCPALDTC